MVRFKIVLHIKQFKKNLEIGENYKSIDRFVYSLFDSGAARFLSPGASNHNGLP
jgi:hypothetical protein